MKEFFIADLHFGHKNILSYDNRQFKSIEEHDETLIKNWNSVVCENDTVYILGDVGWYKPAKMVEVLNRLTGRKRLIVGNHDAKYLNDKDFRACFEEITHYKERTLPDGRKLVLCHYPIPCFNGHYKGAVHLYGHVHISFEYNMMRQIKYEMKELYNKPCNMYNVGCMLPEMGYTPRTFEEIILWEGLMPHDLS